MLKSNLALQSQIPMAVILGLQSAQVCLSQYLGWIPYFHILRAEFSYLEIQTLVQYHWLQFVTGNRFIPTADREIIRAIFFIINITSS